MAYLHFNTMALETGVTMAGTDWSAYRAHQVVWQFFGDHADRDRDFLYRFDPVQGEPFFSALLQSVHPRACGEQLVLVARRHRK